MTPEDKIVEAIDDECLGCEMEEDERCPQSKRPCGHHCNHIWTHDECHWCGLKEYGDAH